MILSVFLSILHAVLLNEKTKQGELENGRKLRAEKHFSKSLIIHQVYSHEIMTVSVFEYLNLTTIDFTIYFSVFSRVSVLIAKIYQTFKTVFDQTNTPQSSSKFVKNTPLRVVFSTLFSVFRNVVKHGLSCLIYYVTPLAS